MKAEKKGNIVVGIIVVTMIILILLMGCATQTYQIKSDMSYSEMTYNWIKDSYPQYEVIEIKEYVFLLDDHQGGLYYLECFDDNNMDITFKKQIR